MLDSVAEKINVFFWVFEEFLEDVEQMFWKNFKNKKVNIKLPKIFQNFVLYNLELLTAKFFLKNAKF